MTATLRLSPCRTCNREISIQAAACPSCGAPNKWVHPKIEHFLGVKDATGIALPFTFNYEKLKISGRTEKKVPRWIFVVAGTLFIAVFVVVGVLGSMNYALHLGLSPIGIIPAIILGLVFRFVLEAVFAKNKSFSMDFETNTWQSNDDKFWAPVKKLLSE